MDDASGVRSNRVLSDEDKEEALPPEKRPPLLTSPPSRTDEDFRDEGCAVSWRLERSEESRGRFAGVGASRDDDVDVRSRLSNNEDEVEAMSLCVYR